MSRALEEKTVAGLHVTEWTATAPPGQTTVPTVLGLPGLSSTGWVWTHLANDLPGHRFIAPDLRGRGGSAQLSGPTGMRAHAKDVAAIAEELDLRDLVVVGHSMGAFLAPLVAQEMGERVSRMVLIDGGPRPVLPFFMTKGMVRLTFTMNLRKADKDYSSVEAFVDRFGKKLIANRPDLRPVLVEALTHDLATTAGGVRPVIDVQRAAADAVDCFFNPEVQAALLGLTVPAHLIAATAGASDKAKAFLADKVIDPAVAQVRSLTSERITGNHLTVLYTPEVIKAVTS